MRIIDDNFDLNKIDKYPTLMAQGNGYLGLRSIQEEPFYNQTPGMYLAGVFNKNPDSETSELVNLPDVLNMTMRINGELFSLQSDKVIKYKRDLDFSSGELIKEVVWESGKNMLALTFKRVVGQKSFQIVAQQLKLKAISGSFTITLESGINGQITNFGTQQYTVEDYRVINDRQLYGKFVTINSNKTIEIRNKFNHSGSFASKNRCLLGTFSFQLENQKEEAFEKLSLVQQSDNTKETNESQLQYFSLETTQYEAILKDSKNDFETFWKEHRIEVLSENPSDQLVLDFAHYHLKIMAPMNAYSSIGAKGLTGEGYKGHVFWDTEIFMLPFYLYTKPKTARDLLIYRYDRLQQAIEKAESLGYEGALFPWESASEGAEETPVYATVNIKTGKRQEVASAKAEHHIVADIAYAVDHYYKVTQDKEFINHYGKELIYQTAKFWLSRATRVNERIEIQNVIGPDEYTEFINNNAYTNYLAKHTVELALEYQVGTPDFQEACSDFIRRIYLPQPNEQGIIPQDDTFLEKPSISLDKYKAKQGKQTILLDYSRDEVIEMQILKQADVVMLNYLLPELFTDEIKQSNLHYYEERTIHDSSLSKAIHAIELIRMGNVELGYSMFKEASLIDLGPDGNSSNDGIHAASLASLWKTMVFGFLGLKVEENDIIIEPQLPTAWEQMTLPLFINQQRLEFQITRETLVVQKESQDQWTITYRDKSFLFTQRLEIPLEKNEDS